MREKLVLVVVALVSGSGAILAQPAPGGRGEPSFEVASIKLGDQNATGASMKFLPGGRLSVSGMTIKNLVTLAYKVRSDRVAGAPAWLDSEHYDIDAKPAPGTAWTMGQAGMDEQFSRIRSLLADRCALRVHHVIAKAPVYELYIGPKGLRILEAKGTDPKAGNRGTILPWNAFVSDLVRRLGRPVIDKTGIKGAWYIKLQYVTDDGKPSGLGVRIDPDCETCKFWPSLLIALQDQLGLKAVSAKGPVDTLVIDSVSRPSEN
jgi:uncharacterized protein (TIGR03435 family)